MHSNNFLNRIPFVIITAITMLLIFALIIRRGSISFGISLKTKTVIMLSVGMLMLIVSSMILIYLPLKSTEIIWIILLRVIYAIWVISPLFILRDIISFWYKIPPIVMIVLSILRLGLWLYYGTNIKTTPLSIVDNRIKQDFKIVFISDIHVEAIHHRNYIQTIVNHIQKIKPDFVIIWGDLMNTSKANYVNAFLPFNQLKMPVYATLGNHDHMWDSWAILQIFGKSNIIPLRNQSIEINWIQLVWIDDKSYRGNKKLPEILGESKIVDNKNFTILVSHQPQNLTKLKDYPIDLELAGHTHHGQFLPISRLIGLLNDYAYGEYHDNWKIAFVSQWIGSRWAPIRIWTQSELVLISLKQK